MKKRVLNFEYEKIGPIIMLTEDNWNAVKSWMIEHGLTVSEKEKPKLKPKRKLKS